MYNNLSHDDRIITFLNNTGMLDKDNNQYFQELLTSNWIPNSEILELSQVIAQEDSEKFDPKDKGTVLFLLETYGEKTLEVVNAIDEMLIEFFVDRWDLLDTLADETGGQDFIENFIIDSDDLVNNIIEQYLCNHVSREFESGHIAIWSSC